MSNKKSILITGGAGFVGSNLIRLFIKKTNFKIISLDNYSSGSKKNHIISKRIIYITGDTLQIRSKLNKYKRNINSLFHFGEFSRIFQSFQNFNECYDSNAIGSKEVFKFCLDNKIKIIYSATSATLGKKGDDKNLSPYAFTKSNNLELLDSSSSMIGYCVVIDIIYLLPLCYVYIFHDVRNQYKNIQIPHLSFQHHRHYLLTL